MKHCVKCQQTKPLEEYPNDASRPSGKYPYCKPCHSAAVQKRTDKAKFAQYKRDNADRQRAAGVMDRARLKYLYGVTREHVEQVREEQDGCCAICGLRTDRLVIDHCHRSGKFRALLCGKCNTAAGFLGDDPEVALRMAAYLTQHAEATEVPA